MWKLTNTNCIGITMIVSKMIFVFIITKVISILRTITHGVSFMPTLATCLCLLRFHPVHFIPYAHRLWSTFGTYPKCIWNNNWVTPFRNGFFIAKRIPIVRIYLNDASILYTWSIYWYRLMLTSAHAAMTQDICRLEKFHTHSNVHSR